ncbi:MAG: hypothetical protein IPI44_24535 [Sulfuritalea sp.]|nr:hypothetical protein [Sulfuritalea sp.]
MGATELFGQLCVDLTALAILLYLWAAANPLISFCWCRSRGCAVPAGRLTAAIALLAVGVYSLLMWQFLPLSADFDRQSTCNWAACGSPSWCRDPDHQFVARMTASIRERDNRLNAAREQALRDERVVALGALAGRRGPDSGDAAGDHCRTGRRA